MISNAKRRAKSPRPPAKARARRNARRPAGERAVPALSPLPELAALPSLRALLRRPDMKALRRALDSRGAEGWIVGGAARDLLLGRPVTDVDLAVTADPFELARDLASAGFGTAVFLSDASPRVARVAGRREIDLAGVEGGGILRDLARRDFTGNAIAIPLAGGPPLDPFGGVADLRRGRLRMIAEANFEDDPLRAIRAARFVATHGLAPDAATAAAARRTAPLLSSAAPERLRVELVKILAAPRAAPALEWAARARLLGPALGSAETGGPGTAAGKARPVVRRASLDDPRIRSLPSEARVRLRLALLGRALGLSGAATAAWLAARRFSLAEARGAGEVLALASSAADAGGTDARWAWIRDAGAPERRAEALLLARLLAVRGRRTPALAALARASRAARRPPRVTGRDVLAWTGLSPGPRVGEILREIEIAGLRGVLQTRDQARRWLARRHPPNPSELDAEGARRRPEL